MPARRRTSAPKRPRARRSSKGGRRSRRRSSSCGSRPIAPGCATPRRASSSGRTSVAVVDWQFNGWAKYPNYQRDDRVPLAASRRHRGMRRFVPPRRRGRAATASCSRAGASTSTARGRCSPPRSACSSEVQQRNPGPLARRSRALFADYLGVAKVLWLGRGIAGDDTHGHVDDLARFVRPGRRGRSRARPTPRDENHARSRENLERLRAHDRRDAGASSRW